MFILKQVFEKFLAAMISREEEQYVGGTGHKQK